MCDRSGQTTASNSRSGGETETLNTDVYRCILDELRERGDYELLYNASKAFNDHHQSSYRKVMEHLVIDLDNPLFTKIDGIQMPTQFNSVLSHLELTPYGCTSPNSSERFVKTIELTGAFGKNWTSSRMLWKLRANTSDLQVKGHENLRDLIKPLPSPPIRSWKLFPEASTLILPSVALNFEEGYHSAFDMMELMYTIGVLLNISHLVVTGPSDLRSAISQGRKHARLEIMSDIDYRIENWRLDRLTLRGFVVPGRNSDYHRMKAVSTGYEIDLDEAIKAWNPGNDDEWRKMSREMMKFMANDFSWDPSENYQNTVRFTHASRDIVASVKRLVEEQLMEWNASEELETERVQYFKYLRVLQHDE